MTIPIKIGEVLNIIPTGRAKTDLYYNYDGFIIFLKDIPQDFPRDTPMIVRVTAIKKTFGFATYEGA